LFLDKRAIMSEAGQMRVDLAERPITSLAMAGNAKTMRWLALFGPSLSPFAFSL
jgi:hypothetical protein